MLRRVITVMSIAAAAVLAPAGAAHATQADTVDSEFPCVIAFESQVVTAGEPFGFTVGCTDMAGGTASVQINVAGEAAGADEAVDVAGAGSAQLTLDDHGTATGTATVPAAGNHTVQVLDADGRPLSETSTITAVGAGPGPVAGGGGVALATTGSTSLPYLVTAGGLLLVGVVAIVVSRVRATRHH